MSDIYKESLEFHKKNKGKLDVISKARIDNRKTLSLAYTPGVAEVCREIAKDPKKVYDYTIKQNSVAVVSDGSAVLGLGNIGAYAAIPVMEGKAALFKEFANIDAFPICLDNIGSDADFIDKIKSITPVFGGINLEDIAAPRCFEIENALMDIGIPVMHDDQHGTAIVVLAALINSSKVVGKDLSELRVVISGSGAAGTAIVKLLHCIGYNENICRSVKETILCDSNGIIHKNRTDLNKYKIELLKFTNPKNREGSLEDALTGADVFIGVSKGNVLTKEMIKKMSKDPIIFAMANPVPEIMPDEAKSAGAKIVGTGRSDFPNQINNVLAFPGVFRGALDSRARIINNEMKLAAAYALSNYVKSPNENNIIPDVLDKNVTKIVAEAVKKAALDSGACD